MTNERDPRSDPELTQLRNQLRQDAHRLRTSIRDAQTKKMDSILARSVTEKMILDHLGDEPGVRGIVDAHRKEDRTFDPWQTGGHAYTALVIRVVEAVCREKQTELASKERSADAIDAELSRRDQARRERRRLEEAARREAQRAERAVEECRRRHEAALLAIAEEEKRRRVEYERSLGPRAYLEERGVRSLLHFTRTPLLPRISRDGLLSRATLETLPHRPIFNDDRRLDGAPDTISCSIGHPNHLTFHQFRVRSGPSTWWCVIAIDLLILDAQPALFCTENAAATGAVPDARRRQAEGDHARALYSDVQCKRGVVKRETLGIPDKLPTHPQAEVLISGNIPPEFLLGVGFPDADGLNWARPRLGRPLRLEIRPGLFRERLDWRHWIDLNHG